MTIQIEWGDDQKTYVYSRFHPGWTWKDNAETRAKYVEMMKSVPHRVDVIGDFTDASTLPTNLFENMRQIANDKLPNEGYVILLGVSYFVRKMYYVIIRIVPSIAKYYVLVGTMEEALEIVASGRAEVIASE